jgi:hypothetical protein
MKNLSPLLLSAILAFAVSSTQGQDDTLRINLGNYSPGSTITVQKNQEFKALIIQNRIPSVAYDIKISAENMLLPALSYDPSGGQSSPTTTAACEGLKDAYMKVLNYVAGQAPPLAEKQESALMPLVDSLRAARKDKECDEEALQKLVDSLLTATTHTVFEEITVGTGEKVTIKIIRGDKVWTFIYKGKEKGQWVPTYGFGFTSASLEGATYYSKTMPDNTIQILQARDPDALDLSYIPAVFYSYFPSQRFNKALNHSLTAGLGFDLEAPLVFLGYNVLYQHNIGFSFGLVFQQQYRLKDQYDPRETISISLDKDQLHDEVYRPNFFVAVHFRFGESPFKSKEEASDE